MDTMNNSNAVSGLTEASTTHPLERAASAWLGQIAADKPELEAHWAQVDRLSHALLASFTSGASPPSQVQATIDWAMHLRLAPGKQGQLIEKMARKTLRWWLYAIRALHSDCGHCIEPLPQDRRFTDPAWDAWPYNMLSQGFLLGVSSFSVQ